MSYVCTTVPHSRLVGLVRQQLSPPSNICDACLKLSDLRNSRSLESRTSIGAQDIIVDFPAARADGPHGLDGRFDFRISSHGLFFGRRRFADDQQRRLLGFDERPGGARVGRKAGL